MKKLSLSLLFFFSLLTAFTQGKFDRKIIIADSNFYAVEIINQIGVLWIGNIAQPMDSAVRYIIPAGTKRRAVNYQPFAWDINNNSIFAINFTENAQNDRATSLKQIPLNNLEKYTSINNPAVYLNKAAIENGSIQNYPFIDTYKNNIYMDDLFFDLVTKGDSIYQFIAINNNLVVWLWDGRNWSKSTTFPMKVRSFFSIYAMDNDVYIIESNGVRSVYRNQPIVMASKYFDMYNSVMINNRDNNSIQFVNANAFVNTKLPLTQIIAQNKIN